MRTNLIKRPLLMVLIAASTIITARAQSDINLLLNANGQTGNMTDWTTVAGGGNGWYVGNSYSGISVLPGSSNAFLTSYAMDVRSQTIDLVGDGFSTAQLDGAPTISISDWVLANANSDAKSYYFVNVLLEDASHNVIASWSDGTQSSPLTLYASAGWTEVTDSLQNYGSGLRYVVFEDGGQDSMFWAGNYGAAFDASSIMVQAVPEPSTLAFAGLSGLSVLLFCRRK
jgi:F-box protein 2